MPPGEGARITGRVTGRGLGAPRAGTFPPPVPDRHELGAPSHAIDGEVLDDPRDVDGLARVLDVVEDRVPGRRARRLRRGRRHTRGELALRRRERDDGLVLDYGPQLDPRRGPDGGRGRPRIC